MRRSYLKKQAEVAAMAEMPENETGTLPGLKPVLEALGARPETVVQVFCKKGLYKAETKQILDICAKRHIPVKFVETSVLQGLCSAHGQMPVTHQGVVARIIEKQFCSLEDLLAKAHDAPLPLLLALDQVQDTGNLGALARTLYALGGAGIILPKHNNVLPGPAAMRASAGALRDLPLARVTNLATALDLAEESGLTIYGTGCQPSSSASTVKKTGKWDNKYVNAFTATFILPAVIVLGNENKGIRPVVAKRCQHFIHIPMARDFDSLNVAQTGAIITGICAAQNYNIPYISEQNS